jgi:hypothetical protein
LLTITISYPSEYNHQAYPFSLVSFLPIPLMHWLTGTSFYFCPHATKHTGIAVIISAIDIINAHPSRKVGSGRFHMEANTTYTTKVRKSVPMI